jgi:hypothetical protein
MSDTNPIVEQIRQSLKRNPFIQYKINQRRYYQYLILQEKQNKTFSPYIGYYRIKYPLKTITYP